MRVIHEFIYDDPIDNKGKEKPNLFLGEFTVVQQISEESYSEQFIGKNEEGIYLIDGVEVIGHGMGGVRYTVTKLKI